ncbi:MAG: tyrosine-type recombinase/integrase [Firmicutes bacterium]|nr:tyrosine-type recombinase/integrase [Bacillota bacterium]
MNARRVLPQPTFRSPLAPALERFLEGKRAAGYHYCEEARALGVLDRFLAGTLAPGDPVITMAVVRAFVARRNTESETTREHRLTLIRQVCRFLALEQPRTAVPGPRFLGIHRRSFIPRVLTHAEGRRFLEACERLTSRHGSPARGSVLGTMLVVLYLTGLRAGEALRLTGADVDLETAILHVRDTKFGKSRLVPIARDVVARLQRCRRTVTRHFGERSPDAPFFPAPSRCTYSMSALRAAFHQVLVDAGIPHRSGGRSLRLHDLRHSFAVLRLTLWYRQHEHPGGLLPALATYMGHVGVASTQCYLQLTEDILADITRRHDARFGHLITAGVDEHA